MQTELALAHNILSTLVPLISLNSARFQVFGASLPSAEMGGDLVDAIERNGTLVAYVADASGHGLPAGQLMGMLKTAMRLGVDLGHDPIALLRNADRVLPGLKQLEMFATLALLCFDDSMVEHSVSNRMLCPLRPFFFAKTLAFPAIFVVLPIENLPVFASAAEI